ncbi:MAG: hypothetical protein Q8934_15335 [Bacillota bacterium]|nr:hypothetical protein [Bacillota bacterium]
MKKDETRNKYSFEFDEQGAIEVSEQINNAYNSGFIDQNEPSRNETQNEEF